MNYHSDSKIDECYECVVRDGDSSPKEVSQCEFCKKWLCEKHVAPKVSFIPNFNPGMYPPQVEMLYEQEYRRTGGHPDWNFSRKKIEELDIEEKTRTELIKKALDSMNNNPPRSPTNPGIPIPIPVSSPEAKPKFYPQRRKRAYPKKTMIYNKRQFRLNIDWRIIKSLKFWFPAFCVLVGILFLFDGNNPTAFYKSVPDSVKYILYIFATGIAGWIGYRIFGKVDSNASSDRGVFGIKLLAGLFLIAAVFMFVFGGLYGIGFFDSPTNPQLSLAKTTIMVFLFALAFAFIMINGYLLYKFERRSGTIIYRG